jgi:hypothetical protein
MPPKEDKDGKKLTKAQLKKLERQRKDDLRNSDSDLSESGSEDDLDGGGKKPLMQMLKEAMREGSKALARSFVDYGPPYRVWKDVVIEPFPIVDCLSEMNMSYVKLHRLLNARVNPNTPDDEDFYNTGMHYAGRHLHFLAARMMRRAGAEVNVINEFGQNPLHCVLENVIAHEKDPRRARQLKFINWLIENDINCHLRDKGGYEPLDFACMNNDMEIILILMEQGCRFRRVNYSFRGHRKNLLEHISDPEVYKFVREHVMEEEDAFQQREEVARLDRAEAAHDKAVRKNLESLAKRKAEKERKQKEAIDFEIKMRKKAAREKSIQTSMDSLTKAKKERDSHFGEWTADEQANWHWKSSSQVKNADEVSEKIHMESVALMQKLHKKNRKSLVDERWAAMGGKGEIEVPWKKSAPFELEGVTDEASVADAVSVDISDDLAHRDENDSLLDGESLADMSLG